MTPLELVLGIVLLVLALAISACVMFQSGNEGKLSGTIAGGNETFFGKSKAHTRDKRLSLITGICSAVFAVVAIVLYIIAG